MATVTRRSGGLTSIERARISSADRARIRKERQLAIEMEQRREDLEGLKFHWSEKDHHILLQSFASVKAEFSDLDGLSWTPSALKRNRCSNNKISEAATKLPQRSPRPRPRVFYPPPSSPPTRSPTQNSPSSTFAILTNADLDSFSADETIRASRSSALIAPPPESILELDPRQRRRSRSPMKGVFDPYYDGQQGDNTVSISTTSGQKTCSVGPTMTAEDATGLPTRGKKPFGPRVYASEGLPSSSLTDSAGSCFVVASPRQEAV